MSKEDIRKKIAGSTVSGGGNNIRDGRGRLVLRRFALESGFKGSRAVFEFVVASSSKIPVTELKTGKALDIEPNAVGSECSYVQMLERHANAFGNVKGIVLELFGEKEATDDELVETLAEMEEKNAAYGRVIDFETYRKITDANKVEIIVPKWYAVEQSDADVQRMRGWMESLTLGAKKEEPAATTTA